MNEKKSDDSSAGKFEREHSSLFNLSRMINAARDLNVLLDFLVKESARLVDAERASLFLYDEKRNELCSHLAMGTSDEIRFDARLGIAGKSLQTGVTNNVEDAYESPSFYPEVDRRTGFKTKSILSVPLKDLRGKSIGVLQTLNKKNGKFTKQDEETLEIFASNAAVAIENSKLIKELEESKTRVQQENVILKDKVRGKFFVSKIIGTSQKLQDVVKLIEKIANSPIYALITGESGTGKELAARMIHFNSSRSDKPFIDINCAALPESLLESELFGIEKGVATGVEKRIGKIELANGGTLFLDEIGDMSLSAQAKFLRVLQERKLVRVGGKEDVEVDVRVIAATNKDLKKEIESGNFREDLFYRLNVVHIPMPPLREIKEDIPMFAKHFLNSFITELSRGPMLFSPEAINCIMSYSWPGNVRELENEIKRLVILAERDVIEEGDLSEHLRSTDINRSLVSSNVTSQSQSASTEANPSLKNMIEELEVQMIEDVLRKTGGNKQKASEILGLTRQGLIKKIKRYGLS